jgi:hypothetical protein
MGLEVTCRFQAFSNVMTTLLQDIFLDAVNFSSQIDFTVSKVDETVR